jgi:hypothetical protein
MFSSTLAFDSTCYVILLTSLASQQFYEVPIVDCHQIPLSYHIFHLSKVWSVVYTLLVLILSCVTLGLNDRIIVALNPFIMLCLDNYLSRALSTQLMSSFLSSL